MLIAVGNPIVDLLDLTNSNKPCSGKVYHACFEVEKALEKLERGA